jgi:putative transposase
MPDAIHLAITIGRRPVAELMRRVTRYCSQRVRERIAPDVTVFPVEFPVTLIDPDAYLVPLIHYIHYIPVLRGIAATPEEYPYTSHFTYLGQKQHLRVNTKRLSAILRHASLH